MFINALPVRHLSRFQPDVGGCYLAPVGVNLDTRSCGFIQSLCKLGIHLPMG